MKNLFFIPCDCPSRDHHLVIEKFVDVDPKTLAELDRWHSLVYISMPHRRLFKRLKNAFWYVLKGGDLWISHDMILSKRMAKGLSEFLKRT